MSTLAAAAGMAPIAAHAAAPVNLVVNTPADGCSDTTPTHGYCTVTAALASPSLVPGSSITINGEHPEDVTITMSGISLGVGPWGGGMLNSVTVSGALDVSLSRLWGDFTVTGSSNVALHQVNGGSLTVTDSQNVTVDENSKLFGSGAAVTIQNSSGTAITQTQIVSGETDTTASGVVVTGSGSKGTLLIGDLFHTNGKSAVALSGGSSGATIADDEMDHTSGAGIAIADSTGNAIVGNTMRDASQAVVATGGSSGLTIADNILFTDVFPAPSKGFAGPMVVVDGTSTSGSSIHHNIVDQVLADGDQALLNQPSATSQVLGQTDMWGIPGTQGPAYSWGGTVYQTAADLQSHTGQGVADLNVDPQFASPYVYNLRATSPAIDSADSSVAGWQSTDYSGAARFQDSQVSTTGTGPTPYADRGAVEFQGGPTVVATVTPVTRPSTTTPGTTDYGFHVDLTGSKSPFAAVKSYGISDYGGGCDTGGGNGTPGIDTVWYPMGCHGLRYLVLSVTDTAGHTDQIFVEVYAGPRNGAPVPPSPPVVVPPVVPPPSGSAGQATVRQIGGGDRYQTSRMVSQAQWGNGKADAVVLARGDAAPDALTGVPLAAKVHGPLLLTDPQALAAADRAELDRVLGGPGSHKKVYILGGTAAVSPGIEAELRKAGYDVRRLSGDNRYETALAVAHQFGQTSHVIVATGRNFPDALAAGPLGAVEAAPIVLSQDTTLDPDTAAFVNGHADVDAVGMQAWTATKGLAGAGHTVSPLYGATRYQTAAAVARQVVRMSGHAAAAPAGVGIASGVTFPDALTGGAFAANAGMPLLLTPPAFLDSDTAGQLHAWASVLSSVTIFGGPNAVTRPVADAITREVHGKAAY